VNSSCICVPFGTGEEERPWTHHVRAPCGPAPRKGTGVGQRRTLMGSALPSLSPGGRSGICGVAANGVNRIIDERDHNSRPLSILQETLG
jgi:hypothetical protein